MDAVYFLIPMTLVLLAAAVGVFVWSLRSGQFEDLDGPAHRVVFDDREEQARLGGNDSPPGETRQTDESGRDLHP